MRIIHRLQNNILKKDRYGKISKLLTEVKWLNINHLLTFQSLLLLWRTWNQEMSTVMRQDVKITKDKKFKFKRSKILLTKAL